MSWHSLHILVLVIFLGTFLLCILGCCGYPFVREYPFIREYQPQGQRDRHSHRHRARRQEEQVDEIELSGRDLPAYEAKETQPPNYTQEPAPESECRDENRGNAAREDAGEEEH